MKKVIKLDLNQIQNQWDLLAPHRLNQFQNKTDNSFENFLKPIIFKYLKDINFKNAVDLGCGVGNLTYEISLIKAGKLHGIDFSSQSIEIAKTNYRNPNLSFQCIDVKSYLNSLSDSTRLDCVIANMFFQDVYPFEEIIEKISLHLNKTGYLIFTITHPGFWPKYWKYDQESWFDYKEEIAIEAPFVISSENGNYINAQFFTTHFHRPMEFYIKHLVRNKFKIIEFDELKPDFPVINYPRFLSIKCIKE